jgi:hypothetical protein
VHSPVSVLNNQFPTLDGGEPDWEKYVARLEELDLAALAITDYFTIEGYKKVLSYRAQGRLKNIALILPNIEFRLNVFVGKNARRVNFHVIFSDEVPVDDIEEHFLSELKFVYEKDPYGPATSKSLKANNLAALGAKLRSEQADLPGVSDLAIGASQAAIQLDELVTCLQRQPDRFEGKYLLVLADEDMSKLSWTGQDHATRKQLLQTCHMVFASNAKTREFLLGRAPSYPEGPAKFVAEFGSLKPVIWGSDAHSLVQLGNPCALRGDENHTCSADGKSCDPRYTWIRADPSFEGLKQLLCEPEDRVVISSQVTSEPRSTFTLRDFSIEGATISSALALAATAIPLNPGLVVITGGKGSGKTALTDLIANCFVARASSADSNSFVRRIASTRPKFWTSFNTIGDEFFKKQVLDKAVFEKSDVVYMPQGELESKVSEGSDFSRYVHSLVFDNERVRNTRQVFDFGEQVDRTTTRNALILRTARKISDLEGQTTEAVNVRIKRGISHADSAIADINARIHEIVSSNGDDLESLLRADEAISKNIDDLSQTRTSLETARALSKEVGEFVSDRVPQANAAINKINELASKNGIASSLATVIAPDVASFQSLEARFTTRLSEVAAKIEEEQKKLSGHGDTRRRHAQLLSSKSDATKTRSQLLEDQSLVSERLEELRAQKRLVHDTYQGLLRGKLENRNLYQAIIQSFLESRETILKDLSFRVHVRFDQHHFEARAEELFDNRALVVRGHDDRKGEFDDLFQAIESAIAFDGALDDSEFRRTLDALEAQLLRLVDTLKSKVKSAFLLDSTPLYELLFGDHFIVEPVVAYKGAEVSKLSLGQKATVLLKIHLAQGDRPIIIDSHDDYLDNEFIMEELIDVLRGAKRYRQIILASNNGNVVVNSDADQLILSKIEDQKISYSSGSLENPTVRARALTVLEGGEAAFKRRQDKYRLGRIR